MTPEEVRFKLLSMIERQPEHNQRTLAHELGVSLGKTNYCMQALIDKGYVKAKNFGLSKNKRKYIYVLTRAGIEARMKQAKLFLARKQEEYELLSKEIRALQLQIKKSETAADGRWTAGDDAK